MCVFAIHLNNSEASNSRLRFKSPWFGASPLLLRVQIDGYHWILMVFLNGMLMGFNGDFMVIYGNLIVHELV